MKTNKFFKAGLVFILIVSIFSFTAFIEYQSVLKNNHQKFKDELFLIQTQLTNILDSRTNSAKNIKTFIQSNKNFDQEDYELYVKEIYESPNHLIKNITFITDTTITHIYPFNEHEKAIGTDLLDIEEQRDLILYAKEENKVVVTGPVYLVEGGKAIVIRIPFVIDGSYFGQINVVYDYKQVMIQSGLQALSDDYFITLSTYDLISHETNEIYSNSIKKDQNESYDISLYDFNLKIEGQPKDGWQGISALFIMILILGLFLSIGVFVLLVNTFSAKEKLKSSYKLLEKANLQLEASNTQLMANEKDLRFRYDEMETQKIQIQHLADRDSLTGLYNRRKCFIDLENLLNSKKKFSLILFNLDHFKKNNETRGHGYGDKILVNISKFLDQFLPKNMIPYRIGGDEFLIAFQDNEDYHTIESFMIKFFEAFEALKSSASFNEYLTVSAGIVSSPSQGLKASTLMMKADLAMRASKEQTNNQYTFFNDIMYQDLNEKVHIENLLRAAVKNEDFHLVYQAIVTSTNQEVYGFEALIRMNNSNISPAIFIPIAEEIGLISTIGKWVISNALLQMKTWQDQGIVLKPLAINLSSCQINEGGIELYLEEQFERFNIDPKLIEIEITEKVFLSNKTKNLKTLENIKNLGCTIALDDFGSGYSSVSHLIYMPVKKIKLDKSLKDKFLPYEDLKVLESLISFCHSLNLKIVTEGIENGDESEQLVNQGSDFLQGFIFSKPLRPDEAIKLIDRNWQPLKNRKKESDPIE